MSPRELQFRVEKYQQFQKYWLQKLIYNFFAEKREKSAFPKLLVTEMNLQHFVLQRTELTKILRIQIFQQII